MIPADVLLRAVLRGAFLSAAFIGLPLVWCWLVSRLEDR